MRNLSKSILKRILLPALLACTLLAQGATWTSIGSSTSSSSWSPLCIASGNSQTWRAVTPCSGANINLTVSQSQSNFNVSTAAKNAGWNGVTPVSIQVTVNSGVTISSTLTSSPALTTGSLPAGSTVTLINNGTIEGRGGNGGNGANGSTPATAGGAGGTAIQITVDTTIQNAGFIYGGGGGGGGGGIARTSIFILNQWMCQIPTAGGGGGGGIGGSSGGAAGSTAVNSGSGGTLTSAGAGGSPRGGAGGSYGATGISGTTGSSGTGCAVSSSSSGGSKGAAGAAVITNGNSLTWTAGNNTTQVKGVVQ